MLVLNQTGIVKLQRNVDQPVRRNLCSCWACFAAACATQQTNAFDQLPQYQIVQIVLLSDSSLLPFAGHAAHQYKRQQSLGPKPCCY